MGDELLRQIAIIPDQFLFFFWVLDEQRYLRRLTAVLFLIAFDGVDGWFGGMGQSFFLDQGW